MINDQYRADKKGVQKEATGFKTTPSYPGNRHLKNKQKTIRTLEVDGLKKLKNKKRNKKLFLLLFIKVLKSRCFWCKKWNPHSPRRCK